MYLETSELKVQINKHKKIFETYEMFTYSFKTLNTSYYYVSYFRFNKCTGIAIVHSGEQPNREKIVYAFKNMYNFNRVIAEARDQLVLDIKRPVSVFEELKQLLNDVMTINDSSLSNIVNDLVLLDKMTDLMISFPEELFKIFKEIQSIEKEVLDRGYLLEENVNDALELNFNHCGIMYNQGREQLDGIKRAMKVINYLKQVDNVSDNAKFKIQKLISHLEKFSTKRAIQELKASQATFEKDEFGNKITIGVGKEGIEDYKQIHNRTVDYILNSHIEKYLRNLN